MTNPVSLSGVFPHLGLKAGHAPARTETGIGALMPWADKLWLITYVAHKSKTGSGTGLFTLDDNLQLTKHPASVVGTYANRMIHAETSQLLIGPHVIDTAGNVRTIDRLVETRLTGVCRHLHEPERKVYILGMEGELFSVDVLTLEVEDLGSLREALDLPETFRPHFKDIYGRDGKVWVVNNSYYDGDFEDPSQCQGRLAEWDGETWTILERTQFNTLGGRVRGELGPAAVAVGQDRASALLKVWSPRGGWMNYRLPKGTHTQDHAWTTEWPRLREVESERWLLDASGIIYEVPAMTYADRLWGVKPVCSHLRIIGDYCSWNGLLVMAGDQTTPINDSNPVVGQPQAGLWFGKTDDLWSWGKPTGWGGPWWETAVTAGKPSDPYLMTGFDQKSLHLSQQGGSDMELDIQVDFRGDGVFHTYARVQIGADGYAHHSFAPGFSAHWLRLVPHRDATVTAQLHYT